VIVVDGIYISSNAELGGRVREYNFKSRFIKILFYDAVSDYVVEMDVNRKD
jgi:hypothetical protein